MLIAILEDDERRREAMEVQLEGRLPGARLVVFDNSPDMVAWLRSNLGNVDLISLDHDLGPNRERDGEVFDPGTGREVSSYLLECTPRCPVIVHSSNPDAAPAMTFELEEAGWSVRRVIPFSDLEWIGETWRDALDWSVSASGGV